MRMILPMIAVIAALAFSAQASPPATPEDWRAAADKDLTAIHDILRDNSPFMVVERDSAAPKRWLDEGLRRARADLPKVSDARGYYFVIQGYVAGFRDSHIQFGPNQASGISLRLVAWPGFVLGLRQGGYEVLARAPDAPDAPPTGARLMGCDGKDVEALVQAHDRYDEDFRLASNRFFGAGTLLVDRGNPFVARPIECSFRVDGSVRPYRLQWRAPDPAILRQVNAALSPGGPALGLGLEPWGEHRWWIAIPSMDTDEDWSGFYAKVKSHLDELRAAEVVVVDLRRNGGGDSSYGDRLARLLWGDAQVNAHEPALGATVWRATQLNRDSWARLVERLSKNADYPADAKAEMRSILDRYDTALAHGDATFTLGDGERRTRPAAGPNPMRGRVIMLTGYSCVSACLDLMDEFVAMPNVTQAGMVTSADTIFMELTQVPELPSGLASFAFGHKAWVKRPRDSNLPYTPAPHMTWPGDPQDTAGLRGWLDKRLAE